MTLYQLKHNRPIVLLWALSVYVCYCCRVCAWLVAQRAKSIKMAFRNKNYDKMFDISKRRSCSVSEVMSLSVIIADVNSS